MNKKIKFTFLGTSAADFSLLRATDCQNRFDKNARRASCMMIEDSLLVDCGMHVLDSIRIAKKDISKITDLFVTHFHADHFIKEHAEQIAQSKNIPLRLWCRQDSLLPEMENVEVIKMEEGKYYNVSPAVNVMAVWANHDETSFPQHYVFEVGEKKVMYATDGAWILSRAIRHLKKINLDALIIDATCGDYSGDRRIGDHNSIPMIRLLVPSLKSLGIINDRTKIYLTHIAPSLHKPHDETQKIVKKDGFIVSYDGMTFNI